MSEVSVPPPAALFDLATDAWTAPFWAAARERLLTAPQCEACGTFRMPPTPFCPECLSQNIRWPTLPGTGTVFSYTVVRKAITPEMADSIPYVPALIDLDEAPGARLITTIVNSPLERLKIGARARVAWHERSDGIVLPCFALADTT